MNKEFSESLEKLKKTEQDSVEWWKAIVERDRAAYRMNRANMYQRFRNSLEEKDKEVAAIRSYVLENLQELQDMMERGIDHKNLISKIEAIINNVFYDEF